MSFRLKRGDMVQVISGAEKGKRGKVMRVIQNKATGDLVIVQGINLRYKHIKRNQKYPQGGRIQKEVAVSLSNVMLLEGDRPVRIRSGEAKGKKVRVSVQTGKPV